MKGTETETREIAAKKTGFTNYKESERTQTVVESGTPDLVAAMEAGEIAVSAAAKIAQQPPEEQARVIELPNRERQNAVRNLQEVDSNKH